MSGISYPLPGDPRREPIEAFLARCLRPVGDTTPYAMIRGRATLMLPTRLLTSRPFSRNGLLALRDGGLDYLIRFDRHILPVPVSWLDIERAGVMHSKRICELRVEVGHGDDMFLISLRAGMRRAQPFISTLLKVWPEAMRDRIEVVRI